MSSSSHRRLKLWLGATVTLLSLLAPLVAQAGGTGPPVRAAILARRVVLSGKLSPVPTVSPGIPPKMPLQGATLPSGSMYRR